jgi:hypothetical protein
LRLWSIVAHSPPTVKVRRVSSHVSDHVAEYYNNAFDEASAAGVIVNAPGDTPGIDFALSPVSE